MKFIDPHLHLNVLSAISLEDMYLAGIREVISPIMLGPAKYGVGVSSDTIIDLWDHLFDVQFRRAENYFIKPYGMIGISMVSTPRDGLSKLLNLLPKYLEKPEVLAVGEVGFQPNSPTGASIKMQEEILSRQLEIAKNSNVLIDIHTPNPPDLKKKYTEKSLDLCQKCNFPMSKVVIDHCSEDNLEMVLQAGAYAAISVQPFRNIDPESAANLVIRYGFEKIMIDSDYGDSPSYHLAVPKTALALKRKNISEKDIEKVCWANARKAYGIK